MEQRCAIVTGAGSGIGRATAVELSRAGYGVVLAGRNGSTLAQTASQIKDALVVVTDITQPDQVQKLIAAAAERFGRIDALINNAGHLVVKPIAKMSDAEWQSTIDTNLSSAFYLTRATWPIFEKQQGGVIVNISSPAARDPFPGIGAYGAAKAALSLLTLVLREGQAIGVRAHSVSPAATETEMFRTLMTPEQYPKDRTLDPKDVAEVIVQCVKGDLKYTSGQVIELRRTL